jgi:endo-alpha-1,4-polygalactosaminidase (GH114 family)
VQHGDVIAHLLFHLQYQLSDPGTVERIPSVDLYFIDLDTARGEIPRLKQENPRVKVVCYFSAGGFERYRAKNDRDRGKYSFSKSYWGKKSIGKPLDSWPGERWLDIRKKRVWWANKKRMQYAKSIGCDGVDPDNVDAYSFTSRETGFKDITKSDEVQFLRHLSKKAHELGLGIGLKNAVELVDTVGREFDWFVSESCVTFGECDAYKNFASKKAVFGVEYCDAKKELGEPTQQPTCVCSKAKRAKMNMLIKRADLGWERFACDENLFIQLEFPESCRSKKSDQCSILSRNR